MTVAVPLGRLQALPEACWPRRYVSARSATDSRTDAVICPAPCVTDCAVRAAVRAPRATLARARRLPMLIASFTRRRALLAKRLAATLTVGVARLLLDAARRRRLAVDFGALARRLVVVRPPLRTPPLRTLRLFRVAILPPEIDVIPAALLALLR